MNWFGYQSLIPLQEPKSRARFGLVFARARGEEIDEVALTLLNNEVLERADIDRILGGIPRAAPSRRGSGEMGIAAATASHPAPRPAQR